MKDIELGDVDLMHCELIRAAAAVTCSDANMELRQAASDYLRAMFKAVCPPQESKTGSEP
jgi:hypothetical protein